MSFPVKVESSIPGYSTTLTRTITLNTGLTVLLGPNGSGKTQLLRGLMGNISSHAANRKVRFISAGRIGSLENYRSDYDGHRSGSPLYEHLSFGSKGDLERRHRIETLNGDFQTLSQRPDIQVKIQERLRKLFRRNLLIEWDAGNLAVKFARLEIGASPYSSGREASGLLHLVGILTALYDDEVGVLLLDEPEVSLHPQLQAFLANEIRSVSGHPLEGPTKKIIIIATHSTEMFKISKPSDLSNLIFCQDIKEDPTQIDPEAGELKNKKVKALVSRLGQEHKLSLFSNRPLLVEGPSDVIICTAIASKLERHLEAAGSQLLPVVGKGQIPTTMKLLRLLGKQPVILVDADAITDGLELMTDVLKDNAVADARANLNGFPTALKMAQTIFSDYCELTDKQWEVVSCVAESHPYWVNRNTDEENQAKRRAAFCILFVNNLERLAELNLTQAWLGIRTRLLVLLDLLEIAGCFVLRRGSIESYYQLSDPFTSHEKATAAAIEMEHIDQLEPAVVENLYEDISRCISYAANTSPINEAESIRDILLSIAAPTLAKMQAGASKEELVISIQSFAGDRAKLFDIDVVEGFLKISLASKVLDIPGLPLTLAVGDNIIDRVNEALGLNCSG
ncbi:UNVERIFIED_ORG: hypothetical protein J3D59_003381 [Pseudomonas fluorescens]